MLRRLVFTIAASLAASAATLGAVAPAAVGDTSAAAVPFSRLAPLPLPLLGEAPGDEFTVAVADTGIRNADGTYQLKCGPAGGTHPEARAACDRLAELAGGGQDPFAPVPRGEMCTMQYGGGATARITGTWRGRSVDAAFNRKNGCEIARWRTLEPVLPSAR
ncbi:SSI family serine proteinase inhibitor [Streptomyces sp. NPDC058405]|uniref:SSI family serine proteinase inhibitor n=1 Tax=Streptomyces sp. NPDC058405 TaxID=3346482 RepID=UPI003663DBE6